jgi:hypothetical protein
LLCRNIEAVPRKRPKLWPKVLILHHDIAPAHKVLPFEKLLAQKPITEIGHPP